MRPIDLIIPEEMFSKAEILTISQKLKDPSVVKYLKFLGVEASKELLSLGTLDMPAEKVANRHLYLNGKLACISTLLSLSAEENNQGASS